VEKKKIAEEVERRGVIGVNKRRRKESTDETKECDERALPEREDDSERGGGGKEEKSGDRIDKVINICGGKEAGEEVGDAGGGESLCDRGFLVAAPESGGEQNYAEESTDGNARSGSEIVIFESDLDEEDAGESEGKAGDPDGEADKTLLERNRRRRRCGSRRLVGNSGTRRRGRR